MRSKHRFVLEVLVSRLITACEMIFVGWGMPSNKDAFNEELVRKAVIILSLSCRVYAYVCGLPRHRQVSKLINMLHLQLQPWDSGNK